MTILLYAYKSKLQLLTALSTPLQHMLKIFLIILIIVRLLAVTIRQHPRGGDVQSYDCSQTTRMTYSRRLIQNRCL